jgi:hypothetical protein
MNPDAGRRLRQNARIPVEQTPRGSTLASTRSYGDNSSASIPNKTYLASLAVNTSAGASFEGTLAPSSPYHTDTQNGMHIATNALTGTSVAHNPSPVSCLTRASCESSSTMPRAPGFSESPVPSVAPNTQEYSDASPSSNSQQLGRHEDARSARSATPHRDQDIASDTGGRSQGNASGALTSSPIRSPGLHPIRDHTTDQHGTGQRDVPDSHQVSDSCEDAFVQQCDLLSLLGTHMFYRDDTTADESILLHSLKRVWTSHEHSFKLALEPRFDGCREALRIWIDLRLKTNELRSPSQRQSSARILQSVDRLLLMNEIRKLHRQWELLAAPIDGQAVPPEDLLCSAFAIMTKTRDTEAMFKEGLENMRKATPEIYSPNDPIISIYS